MEHGVIQVEAPALSLLLNTKEVTQRFCNFLARVSKLEVAAKIDAVLFCLTNSHVFKLSRLQGEAISSLFASVNQHISTTQRDHNFKIPPCFAETERDFSPDAKIFTFETSKSSGYCDMKANSEA